MAKLWSMVSTVISSRVGVDRLYLYRCALWDGFAFRKAGRRVPSHAVIPAATPALLDVDAKKSPICSLGKVDASMLSLTSEYALRAMIHLAQRAEEWPITGKQIAKESGIPAKYLSKVLGDLVRAGVLESARGIGGGFRMVRPPRKVALYDILAPFEPLQHRRCPFGNQLCGDDNPCLAHDRWKKVVETEKGFLKRTSIFDVAVSEMTGTKKKKRAK